MKPQRTRSKLINCDIHGAIRLSGMAVRVIDTPEFQRLRQIQQLGATSHVYPTACHTRFEHSIGVYYLAGLMINRIQQKYPGRRFHIPVFGEEPVEITDTIVECVKLAGLCHDLGHGPFSHIFDQLFVQSPSPNRDHETRSCLIMERICQRVLSDELDQTHIQFIKSLIDPSPNEKGAIYQIIANKLNGIDVDKFDYLVRDSRNLGLGIDFSHSRLINEFIVDASDNIAFPKQCSTDVYCLFHSRYVMNKKVYLHKTVDIVSLMIQDIFRTLDPVFDISSSIDDLDRFCSLTDQTIFERLALIADPPSWMKLDLRDDHVPLIRRAQKIYDDLIRRRLYRLVREFLIEKDEDRETLNQTRNDLVRSGIRSNDLIVVRRRAGYVGSDISDPFANVYFYSDAEETNSFVLKPKYFSLLINGHPNEEMGRIIYRGSDAEALGRARRLASLAGSGCHL